MESQVYFGRLIEYTTKDNNVIYYIDYMGSNGTTHRERISQSTFNHFRALNFHPCDIVTAVFDVDAFNHCTLIDLK